MDVNVNSTGDGVNSSSDGCEDEAGAPKQFKPFTGERAGRPGRPPGALGVGRMNARAALQRRVARLRYEADALEALLRALPMELPEHADFALWDLAMKARG